MKFNNLLFICALCSIVSCSKDAINDGADVTIESKFDLSSYSVEASINRSTTRVDFNDNGMEQSLAVEWENGDTFVAAEDLSDFDSNTTPYLLYTYNDDTQRFSADAKNGIVASESATYYAKYYASEATNVFTQDGISPDHLSDAVVLQSASFTLKDQTLSFAHTNAYLRLSFETPTTPKSLIFTDDTNNVKLNFDNATTEEYIAYFAVSPMAATSRPINITMIGENGKSYTFATTTSVSYEAGKVYDAEISLNQNLVSNGDFESATSLAGWTFPNSNKALEVAAGAVIGGEQSLRLTAANTKSTATQTGIKLEAGRTYSLSFSGRVQSFEGAVVDGAVLTAAVYSHTDPNKNLAMITIEGNSNKTVSIEFTSDATYEDAYVSIWKNKGIAFVDNVIIQDLDPDTLPKPDQEDDEPVNIIVDGTFDNAMASWSVSKNNAQVDMSGDSCIDGATLRFSSVGQSGYCTQNVALKANTTYKVTLTGRIQGTGGPSGTGTVTDGVFGVKIKPQTTGPDIIVEKYFNSNTDKEFSFEFTTPSTDYPEALFVLQKSKGIAYVDNVSMQEVL